MDADLMDAPGIDEYADAQREQDQRSLEFKEFLQTKIYRELCECAAHDETAAIEALIEAKSKGEADEQRIIIARCRYFSAWAMELNENLNQADTDPAPQDEEI